jgi:hypothetical protein
MSRTVPRTTMRSRPGTWCRPEQEVEMTTANIGAGGAEPRPVDPDTTGYWEQTVTGWAGYLAFASTMLCLVGSFHIIQGVVGIFRDGYFFVPKEDLLVKIDYTAWGWIHVGLGALAIAVGIGFGLGQMWARILGVLVAVLSTLTNLAFLNAYPVWSVLVIAFNVLVIWALTVHGAEMKYRNDQLM